MLIRKLIIAFWKLVTTYESAALATPVISFDKCNASDFVNENNGALVDTYDVKKFAEEMYRFANYDANERKSASLNMHATYENLMDTKCLINRWEEFFARHGV
jgi:glycosyltransferase involved in cell wall biosynthesis